MLRDYPDKIKGKNQRKQELVRLVTLGRNSIEPVLQDYREGNISRPDALTSVRNTIRQLVYDDPSTRNYLFMSAYDGTMLVQPYNCP
jgi:signal transduction histidine kinase